MYLTVKQQIKQLSKEDYKNLKSLAHYAKNLANEAIYSIRQHYFAEQKCLSYEKNYLLLKNSDNYKALNSNMAQQILKEVDGTFKSFFGLIKLARQGKYSFKDCKLPPLSSQRWLYHPDYRLCKNKGKQTNNSLLSKLQEKPYTDNDKNTSPASRQKNKRNTHNSQGQSQVL